MQDESFDGTRSVENVRADTGGRGNRNGIPMNISEIGHEIDASLSEGLAGFVDSVDASGVHGLSLIHI